MPKRIVDINSFEFGTKHGLANFLFQIFVVDDVEWLRRCALGGCSGLGSGLGTFFVQVTPSPPCELCTSSHPLALDHLQVDVTFLPGDQDAVLILLWDLLEICDVVVGVLGVCSASGLCSVSGLCLVSAV